MFTLYCFSTRLRLTSSIQLIYIGIPVPIVAVTAGIAHDHYGHEDL